MRISAEEARKIANLKTSGESILNEIFKFIKVRCEFGTKDLTILSSTTFNECNYILVRELFDNEEKYKYIEETLISLGYKVKKYNNDFITINWE